MVIINIDIQVPTAGPPVSNALHAILNPTEQSKWPQLGSMFDATRPGLACIYSFHYDLQIYFNNILSADI